MNISPDEIVITAGALEALNLSLQAVTEPGDWVVVENPCFYGALQALEAALKALSVATDVKEGIDLTRWSRRCKITRCLLADDQRTESARLYPQRGKKRSWWRCWRAIT
jgi:DNA-binding transcriptional MocR family regulator